MRGNGLGSVRLFGYLLFGWVFEKNLEYLEGHETVSCGIKRLGRRMIPQFDSARDGKRKRIVMEFGVGCLDGGHDMMGWNWE